MSTHRKSCRAMFMGSDVSLTRCTLFRHNPGVPNLGRDLSFSTGLDLKRVSLTVWGYQIHKQFLDFLGNPFLNPMCLSSICLCQPGQSRNILVITTYLSKDFLCKSLFSIDG